MSIELMMGDYVWVYGIGLAFALTIMFGIYLKLNLVGFLGFLTITVGFCVWGGLLPSWSLIICLVFFVGSLAYHHTREDNFSLRKKNYGGK